MIFDVSTIFCLKNVVTVSNFLEEKLSIDSFPDSIRVTVENFILRFFGDPRRNFHIENVYLLSLPFFICCCVVR